MDRRPSTRLSIVHQSLGDIVERLGELPLTAVTRDLRIRATAFEKRVNLWERIPPSEDERADVMKAVLDLNMEVIAAARAAK
jgi:hypothetical protein